MKQQAELFNRNWGAEFLDAILKKLPKNEIIGVSEAAEVMNRCNSTVITLCEQGDLVAVNTSTGSRRNYDILTSSIVEFYKRRLGITDEKPGTPSPSLARK